MIGTVEALGVFLVAVLPGFVGLRVYGLGRPPLHDRGALHELGVAVAWSLLGWAALFWWRGRDLLPVVLDGERSVGRRLDAFAELVALAILIGAALALIARSTSALIHIWVSRDDPTGLLAALRKQGVVKGLRARTRARLSHEIETRSVPGAAWDRLLARLNNQREPVVCRVVTSDGREVLGILADEGYADWSADGRGLLLMPEVVRDQAGRLQPVPASRGVYVAGEQITTLSAVAIPKGSLTLEADG
jgi:hypothetical protein